ncbi:MAG TPA: TRAP transporter small permease subunit, partial [Stellaceae bacterium]|nr:TRAP transporter small permease subunit [Stellaceae bacterium]
MSEPARAPVDHHASYSPKKLLSFEGLVVLMNALGSVMIVLIMAMICTDIASRYLLDRPIRGVTELTEFFIVGIVFMQLAHAIRLGKLTRSDGAYGLLLWKLPWLGHSLGAIYDLAGATLLSIIAYGAWPKLLTAWERHFFFGNVGVFTFPEWPIWALL